MSLGENEDKLIYHRYFSNLILLIVLKSHFSDSSKLDQYGNLPLPPPKKDKNDWLFCFFLLPFSVYLTEIQIGK